MQICNANRISGSAFMRCYLCCVSRLRCSSRNVVCGGRRRWLSKWDRVGLAALCLNTHSDLLHALSSTPIMICSNINQPRSQQWSLERMQHQLRWASSVRFRYNHRAEVWALCLPSYRDGSFRGGMSFLGGLNKKKKTTKNLSCSLLF